jgi:hypothetical protein
MLIPSTGTQKVQIVRCTLEGGRKIYLVDTPGFDSYRSGHAVLRELANFLTVSYSIGIELSGIIFLHRISDVHMSGSAKGNLLLFKKLCGTHALRNVILATTMWNQVTLQEGAYREAVLTASPEFWGWMIEQGTRVVRHTNDRESVLRLIGFLVNKGGSKVTLELQHQMVIEQKTFGQTDVGLWLQAVIAQEREKPEKQVQQAEEEMKGAIRLKRDDEALKTSMKKLHEKKNTLAKHIEVQKELKTAEQENQHLLVEFSKLQTAQTGPAPNPLEWSVVVALSTRQYYLAGPGGTEKTLMCIPPDPAKYIL